MSTWIQRQRYMLDFTLSCLWRRKARNLALLLCYTLVVFLLASVLFFSGSLQNEALTILEDAPQLVVQRMIGGRQTLIPVSYAEKIGRIRGVGSVQPRRWGYYYHPAARANYTVMASGTHNLDEFAARVGRGVLRTWETDVGQSIYFKAFDGQAVSLQVAEVFPAVSELVSADLIIISEAAYARIFGVPQGMATDLSVQIRNPLETRTISQKVLQLFPDTRPVSKSEIQRTYNALFDWRSGYVIVLLSGAVLAFFIFTLDKATGLSAAEKTEIAVLKAVGWDTSHVLTMKIWEGLVISLLAFLLGVLAAYVHVFFSSATLFEHALKGWAVLYPSFRLSPVFNYYELAVIFALTVIPYTFITVVPAWRAAITDPDTAMRGM